MYTGPDGQAGILLYNHTLQYFLSVLDNIYSIWKQTFQLHFKLLLLLNCSLSLCMLTSMFWSKNKKKLLAVYRTIYSTLLKSLADFTVGHWWSYCKALCDEQFSRIEGNGGKFSHIELCNIAPSVIISNSVHLDIETTMLRRISAISVVIESIQLEYCLMDVWFQNYSDKVMENCGLRCCIWIIYYASGSSRQLFLLI